MGKAAGQNTFLLKGVHMSHSSPHTGQYQAESFNPRASRSGPYFQLRTSRPVSVISVRTFCDMKAWNESHDYILIDY